MSHAHSVELDDVLTIGKWVMIRRAEINSRLAARLPDRVTVMYYSHVGAIARFARTPSSHSRFALSRGVSGKYYLIDEREPGWREFAAFDLMTEYLRTISVN